MSHKNIKEEIKEILRLIGLSAAGGIVVFHVNSFAGCNRTATRPEKQHADTTHVVASPADTIMRDTIAVKNSIAAARDMFLSGMKRGLPTR